MENALDNIGTYLLPASPASVVTVPASPSCKVRAPVLTPAWATPAKEQLFQPLPYLSSHLCLNVIIKERGCFWFFNAPEWCFVTFKILFFLTFIILFFNYSLLSLLFCIGFSCAAQWASSYLRWLSSLNDQLTVTLVSMTTWLKLQPQPFFPTLGNSRLLSWLPLLSPLLVNGTSNFVICSSLLGIFPWRWRFVSFL